MLVWTGEYNDPDEEHNGLPKAYDVLKEAKEPCVHLKLLAHGGHEEPTGNHLSVGLLIPQSVVERMVALGSLSPYDEFPAEVVDAIKGPARRILSEIQQWEWKPEPRVAHVPEDWLGALEVWRTGTIAITHAEIKGLDRQGFREVLRAKVQALGDELLKVWEAENEG